MVWGDVGCSGGGEPRAGCGGVLSVGLAKLWVSFGHVVDTCCLPSAWCSAPGMSR